MLFINSLNRNNLLINKEMVEKFLKSSIKNEDIYDLTYKDAKDKFEKEYLIQKLKLNNWNMTITAKMLKLDRVSLYRKIKSLNSFKAGFPKQGRIAMCVIFGAKRPKIEG